MRTFLGGVCVCSSLRDHDVVHADRAVRADARQRLEVIELSTGESVGFAGIEEFLTRNPRNPAHVERWTSPTIVISRP